MQDSKLKTVRQVLKGELHSEQGKQIKKEYEFKNNCLYRRDGNELKFVLPATVRGKMLQLYHDQMGHYGVEKTLQRLRRDFWFPGMRKFTKQYVAACVECCHNKSKGGKTEGELHVDEFIPIPFATLHIDHLGPIPKSKRQNNHLIVAVDAFSKFVVVRAVRNAKTQPVINLLNELTTFFGLSKRIVTDRGTAFTSHRFEQYCRDNHIQHIKNAVRTPQANGQVERFNRTIMTYLKSNTENNKNRDDQVRKIQWELNTQKNKTTGFTPNELVFDFELRDLIPNRLVEVLHDEKFPVSDMTVKKRREAVAKIHEQRQKWKARFDAHHRQPPSYKENYLVVIENAPAATGESRKLEPRYWGPYVVRRSFGRDR
ncbi:Pro-Pol polyprotein [Anthophora plagiata]